MSFAEVGGLGRRAAPFGYGGINRFPRVLSRPLTESEMSHNAWLWKEARETMYLWAAAGVSVAVIFAIVAL